jgi:YD repeat-containing protein
VLLQFLNGKSRYVSRALTGVLLFAIVKAVSAQTPSYSCGCDGATPSSSCGVLHPTFSAAAEALKAAVTSSGVTPCSKHRAESSSQRQDYTNFRAPFEQPTSYYVPGAPTAPTPEAACRNYYDQTNGVVVFDSLFRYPGAPFPNVWACLGWVVAEQRYSGAVFVFWNCNSPSAPFFGGDAWGLTVPPGVYCWPGARGGVFTNNTATIERPQQCPVLGNPVQVNSEEKIDRETDYAGLTLRFDRYYGSQKIARRGGGFIHSFAEAVQRDGLAAGHSRSDGVIVRFTWSTSTTQGVPMSADLRTSIFVNPAETSPGAVRYKIQSLVEPRIDTFDYFGRNLKRMFGDGRSITFTHIDEAGVRVPATAPVCTVLIGGTLAPNQATPSTLQCVTDDFGRQLNFRYDVRTVDGVQTQVNLVQMVDPAGNVYQYAYDEATSVPGPVGRSPANNLTSVTYPDGYRRLYHYNEPENTSGTQQTNALTGVTEAVPTLAPARLSTYRYDTSGRAIYTERANGAEAYRIDYVTPWRTVVITNPLGTQRTQSFGTIVGVERPTGSTQPAGSGSSACSDTMTYDAQGNVASRIDFNGNKVCYAYDLTRNLQVKRVEGLAASADCTTAFASPPPGARVITTEWHPDWRLQTRVATPKRITATVYNGHGATCAPDQALVDGQQPLAVICSTSEQATTDESGALGFSATPIGAPRISSSTYTTFGRMLTATDANGKTTTYAYYADDHADLGKRGNVATITNPAHHVTEFTDYNLHGQATRVADANGLVTTDVYDVRLRLRSRTSGSHVTAFDYHPAGHLTQATLPDGSALSYGYDAAHRPISVQDQKGNRIDYTLNGLGVRTGEEVRDAGGLLVKNITRVFDALNRLERVTGETR